MCPVNTKNVCRTVQNTFFFFFIKVLWRQRDFWAEYQKYLLIWQCVHMEIQSADCYKVNKRKRKWSELYDVANTCEWEGRWVGEWNDLCRRRTSQLGQGGANAVLKNTLAHHLLYPTLILTCFSCFLCPPPGKKKLQRPIALHSCIFIKHWGPEGTGIEHAWGRK